MISLSTISELILLYIFNIMHSESMLDPDEDNLTKPNPRESTSITKNPLLESGLLYEKSMISDKSLDNKEKSNIKDDSKNQLLES